MVHPRSLVSSRSPPVLALILLLLLATRASAANYSWNVTGSSTALWNLASNWSSTAGPGIPGPGDTATISTGLTATIPAGYTATVAALSVTGTLQLDSQPGSPATIVVTTTGGLNGDALIGTGTVPGVVVCDEFQVTTVQNCAITLDAPSVLGDAAATQLGLAEATTVTDSSIVLVSGPSPGTTQRDIADFVILNSTLDNVTVTGSGRIFVQTLRLAHGATITLDSSAGDGSALFGGGGILGDGSAVAIMVASAASSNYTQMNVPFICTGALHAPTNFQVFDLRASARLAGPVSGSVTFAAPGCVMSGPLVAAGGLSIITVSGGVTFSGSAWDTTLSSLIVDSGGMFTAAAAVGSLTAPARVSVRGGTFMDDAGSVITGITTGGTFTGSSLATTTFSGYTINYDLAQDLYLAGPTILDGHAFACVGACSCGGNVLLTNAASVTVVGGTPGLTASPGLALYGPTSISSPSADGTLATAASGTIVAASYPRPTGLVTSLQVAVPTTNLGQMAVTSGTIVFTAPLTSHGSLDATATGTSITVTAATEWWGRSLSTGAAPGTLLIGDGTTATSFAIDPPAGTGLPASLLPISIAMGSSARITAGDGGSLAAIANAGTLAIACPSTISLGGLDNAGTVRLEAGLPTTITGALSLQASGTLVTTISSATAYDSLVATPGPASVAGALVVEDPSGYAYQAGDRFTIVSPSTGAFTTLSGAVSSGAVALGFSSDANSIVLDAEPSANSTAGASGGSSHSGSSCGMGGGAAVLAMLGWITLLSARSSLRDR